MRKVALVGAGVSKFGVRKATLSRPDLGGGQGVLRLGARA